MTPLQFLTELWRYKPEEHYILIWTHPDKRSRWFTNLPAAAEYVTNVNGGRDVYIGVGLSKADYGPARRCKSDEITGICAIATDLDLKSEAHGNKPLPATIEDALSILPASTPPSLLISTGNGVHAWWLLKEPYVFDSDDDRQEAASVLMRWHTMLRLRAAARGWSYDRLSDLARVLRIPGTVNHKDQTNPKNVVVLSETDHRYNMSDFQKILDQVGVPDTEAEERERRDWAERFADKPLVINVGTRVPQEILDEWMRQDPRFRNTWERRRHDLKDSSNSGYDMALADFGVDAGLSEQRIVDLIIHHRALHGRPQRTRLDYFRRTIAKAMEKADGGVPLNAMPPRESSRPAQAQTREGDESLPPDPEPQQSADPDMAKGLLCKQISEKLGVEIVRLVKFEGKEPTYHLQMEQGKIEFPSVDKLINYGPVRSAIAAKVGRIIRKIKPKEWEQIAQMMLDACFVEECTEEEDFEGAARAHVLDYLQETDFIPSIEGQRVQDQRRPMIADGRILVCSSDFQGYLNKTKGLNLSVKAAASMLGAVGAKKTDRLRSIKYKSQTRWALPAADFNPADIRPIGGAGEISHG